MDRGTFEERLREAGRRVVLFAREHVRQASGYGGSVKKDHRCITLIFFKRSIHDR